MNHTPYPPPKNKQVGKTSLIKGLVKHYTKQNLADPLGPITLVTGGWGGVGGEGREGAV